MVDAVGDQVAAVGHHLDVGRVEELGDVGGSIVA
jgi:hypothetical protein